MYKKDDIFFDDTNWIDAMWFIWNQPGFDSREISDDMDAGNAGTEHNKKKNRQKQPADD